VGFRGEGSTPPPPNLISMLALLALISVVEVLAVAKASGLVEFLGGISGSRKYPPPPNLISMLALLALISVVEVLAVAKGLRVGRVPGWDFGGKEVPPSPYFDINDINASSASSACTGKGFRVVVFLGGILGSRKYPPPPNLISMISMQSTPPRLARMKRRGRMRAEN